MWTESYLLTCLLTYLLTHLLTYLHTYYLPDLAARQPLAELVPRWGRPHTSWPLVYVSAHGYGVVEADDAPPLYYWARFAQKATNAGAQGPMSARPFGQGFGARSGPIGPKGPALRGWDSTTLFEKKLRSAGVQVRVGAAVAAIQRDDSGVYVRTAGGGGDQRFEKLVLATDLKVSCFLVLKVELSPLLLATTYY